jgi:chromosome segregation ATPase
MQFQSSYARQARLFYHSRELWRQRAAEKQREIRALRVKVRDLAASREHWKGEARHLAEHVHDLQAQLHQRQIPAGCLGGQ